MTESDAATAAVGEEPVPPVVTGRPEEIADGVFVVPDGRVPLVPNIGVVVGDRAALVVDTAMGPRNGEVVHGIARELAGDRPLYLTVTHFHPEHGYGAQAFRDATIVYNREQHEELRDKGQLYVDMFRTFGPEVAEQLEGVELVQPNVVYDGAADLDLGGKQVRLRTWGLAHTRGDQIVFLPAERVLFTGDLVENRFFSIFPHFPPDDADVNGSKWIAVLEQLERLEPAIVVPGHGEVGGAGLIAAAREYLELLRSETKRLAGEGADADAIIAMLEPQLKERYPDWGASEWIAFGVRCFLAE
jgi:glyoxylase-like metal-dependent hydrolase (beta-lactamase superfamily II)